MAFARSPDGETKVVHHAQFSPEIVHVIEKLLQTFEIEHVHDPFAGPGARLGELCRRLGMTFSGAEIEESFIVDPGVIHADSTQPDSYPWYGNPRGLGRTAVVTSPVYPNGMADHHEAKDESERKTYRSAVTENEGRDRELHPNNMGRYGYRNTKRLESGGRSVKRKTFWRIAEECVTNWHPADLVIVNVSDFISAKEIEPFTEDWMVLMERHGWFPLKVGQVGTQRMTYGSDDSRDERLAHEWVLVYEKRQD